MRMVLVHPQPQPRIPNKVKCLASSTCVPAILDLFNAVFPQGGLVVAKTIVHRFDFGRSQFARTVLHLKAILRRTMYQVGSYRKIASEIRILGYHVDDFRCGSITIATDQLIHIGMLAELLDARCNHHQSSTIRDRHSSPINCFVGNPRLFVLARIHPDDHLLGGFWQSKAIHFGRKRTRFVKHRMIIPNIQTTYHRSLIRCRLNDSQHINHRAMSQKEIRRSIQDTSQRSIASPHHSFHAEQGA